jgi:protein-arginine kinase activator protein McsA
MICQCCHSQKARLHNKDSELIPGTKILICTKCVNEGHEPRHNVILGSFSGRDVSKYVVDSLYCGKSLQANEVIHRP